MRSMRRHRLMISVALGLVLGLGGGALAAFSSTTANSANRFVAAADWEPPHVTRTAIAKTALYLGGRIHQGSQFYVYAQIDDGGNPPAGVGTVTANVSAFSSAGIAVPLAGGAFTMQGVLYNFRSAALTATNPLAAGSRTYSITMTDIAATPNSQTQGGFTVVIDNTSPAPADMTSANKVGGTRGLAEPGDSVTYTFSEPMDPESLVPGWNGGSPTTVQVRIRNRGNNDQLFIRTNAGVVLDFGTVLLQQNYVQGSRNFSSSAITMFGNQVTIVMGVESGASLLVTVPSPTTWTANAGAYDAAGNACSATSITGSGSPRIDF